VSDLSAAGTAVGLTFGVAVSPIVAALVTRPPLAPTADPPAHRPTGKVGLRAGRVTIGACRLTGLRVGWRRPLPTFLIFSAGLAAVALCDRYWRVLPKRVVYPTWVAGLAGLAAAAGLILIAAGRLERRGSLPLGTYLGAGTAIVVWVWH
jgi:hypothetical protein